ncbi:hypothetical protein AKJ16_DCAP06226 [Drosera capensis]
MRNRRCLLDYSFMAVQLHHSFSVFQLGFPSMMIAYLPWHNNGMDQSSVKVEACCMRMGCPPSYVAESTNSRYQIHMQRLYGHPRCYQHDCCDEVSQFLDLQHQRRLEQVTKEEWVECQKELFE